MGIKYNPFAGNLDIVDSPSGDFSSLDINGDLTVDTTTLHVDSTNDRVGIGTTSPQDELHVDGNDATIRVNDPRSTNPLTISQLNTSAEIIHGGNGGLTFGLSNIGDINFVNQVSKTSRMVIANDGKVGIGTTSPSSKLVVEDDTFIYFDLNRTGGSAGLCRLANSGNVLDISNNVNGVTFSTGSTPSEAVRINNNGRMGIGTSSPAQILHVVDGNSTIRLESTTTDNSGSIEFLGKDASNNAFYPGLINSISTGQLRIESDPYASAFASDTSIAFRQSGAEIARFDSNGRLGIGTTSPNKILHISGTDPIIQITDTDAGINSQIGNVGDDLYISNDFAAAGASSTIQFWNAGSEVARIDASGNILLGGTSTPGSATKSLAIFNGTAPTGSVADGVLLYAEDVSSSSELKVRDEAGNITTLSPHNFDLIPEGPSEDMAWSYYSEKDGKRINVDMLRAIRILEQLSGEQLVFSS